MSSQENQPVLIELDTSSKAETPATAPPVPEPEIAPSGQAIQTLAVLAARKPSRIRRLFWAALIGLLGLMASLAMWDFVFSLVDRNIWLGRIALGVTGLFVFSALVMSLREWLAFARFRRMDGLRHMTEQALASQDMAAARKQVARLVVFYRGRADMRWALDALKERQGDVLDPDALLAVTENTIMAPLDTLAQREVEAAARQVATITAIVPLALADVATALFANLRMVRRIAEIYGGRAGTFGSWRLLRTVLLHLVATGAVAIGDDLIGSLAGGGIVSKFSRRFGEGVINGALTARVGVAAMEVCRPMPFHALKRPGVAGVVKQALAGLFGSSKK